MCSSGHFMFHRLSTHFWCILPCVRLHHCLQSTSLNFLTRPWKKKLRQIRTEMKHIRENNLDRCRQMNRLLGIELIFFQPFNLMPRVKMPFQHIQFESCLWLRQFCLRMIQGRDLANVSFWLRGVGDFLVEWPRKVGRLCEGFNFGSALGARQLSNQIKMSFAVILQQWLTTIGDNHWNHDPPC